MRVCSGVTDKLINEVIKFIGRLFKKLMMHVTGVIKFSPRAADNTGAAAWAEFNSSWTNIWINRTMSIIEKSRENPSPTDLINYV